MAISITIDNLDDEIWERLRAEAQRRGMEAGALVRELLTERLGSVAKITSANSRHDLDTLAGTWSEEEANAFLSVVADFGHVDEDMWK